MLTRTKLRLDKKAAEGEALIKGKTLQAMFSSALEEHLNNWAKLKAKKILFKNHSLGEPHTIQL